MIADVHAHAIPPEMLSGAPAGVARAAPVVTRTAGRQVIAYGGAPLTAVEREIVDVDAIVEARAADGIDFTLLAPWVPLLGYDLPAGSDLEFCRRQNEALCAMARRHPGRVRVFGTVPLQRPEVAARELQDLAAAPEMVGVEVGTSVRGVYLGDERFLPFWAAAEESVCLVFIHPVVETGGAGGAAAALGAFLWNTVGNPLETAIAAAHLVMSGVLEAHPGLRVILAHGGGALMSVRGRLRHASTFHPDVRARLRESPLESIRRFYVDTLTHDADLLRSLVAFAGPDRVLMGSDYPFAMGDRDPAGFVRSLGLPQPDEGRILGGNAARLLER